MTDLLPCPFCRSPNVENLYGIVQCSACLTDGPMVDDDNGFRWNDRPRERELENALSNIIQAYKRANPVRTADQHLEGCDCFRCEIDRGQALLQ